MYRITLSCYGIPSDVGEIGASDIAEEFTHRPWHQNVKCEWDGSHIILQAENDFDETGEALVDEFGDAIIAYIHEAFEGGIEIVSVIEFTKE